MCFKRKLSIITGILVILFITPEKSSLSASEKDDKLFADYYRRIDSVLFIKDTAHALDLYIDLASEYIYLYENEKAIRILEAAPPYLEKYKKPSYKAKYYRTWGDYHNQLMNDSLAHKNYYTAIEYFKQGGENRPILNILHNMAFYHIQKRDTASLRRITEKMTELISNEADSSGKMATYRVLGYYHNLLYMNSGREVYLDSAIYYRKAVIHTFNESGCPAGHEYVVAYDMNSLAEYMMEKGGFPADTILYYLENAMQMAFPTDTAMLVNNGWALGKLYYKEEKLEEAKNIFTEQLELLDSWSIANDLQIYIGLYEHLFYIYVLQNNPKEALRYEKLKSDHKDLLYERQKQEVIADIQTKYMVAQKNNQINELQQKANLRLKLNRALLIGFILIIFLLAGLIRFLRNKQKIKDQQLLIYEMKQNEVEYEKSLKEEQLKKAHLERYEALTDSFAKGQALEAKDTELKKLQEIQDDLNKKIDNYSRMLKEYKESHPIIQSDNVQELSNIINQRLNKLPVEKAVYLEKLKLINEQFETRLQGKITRLNILYCICFAIGMKHEHIAQCFSIQAAGLRTKRTRIKEKLEIGQHTKLDAYLHDLLIRCTTENKL